MKEETAIFRADNGKDGEDKKAIIHQVEGAMTFSYQNLNNDPASKNSYTICKEIDQLKDDAESLKNNRPTGWSTESRKVDLTEVNSKIATLETDVSMIKKTLETVNYASRDDLSTAETKIIKLETKTKNISESCDNLVLKTDLTNINNNILEIQKKTSKINTDGQNVVVTDDLTKITSKNSRKAGKTTFINEPGFEYHL